MHYAANRFSFTKSKLTRHLVMSSEAQGESNEHKSQSSIVANCWEPVRIIFTDVGEGGFASPPPTHHKSAKGTKGLAEGSRQGGTNLRVQSNSRGFAQIRVELQSA